ncbi:hypothetical protein BCR44DRAFT_68147 [Catenaria anguillulae PL171]|uniref:Uncharacterized protein n=1 Tax=Catenaria anguillulae PL171 TaxID=765915 RepID=A0A1Y2H8B3_9FUNG|nr:hypothetical protein BCR44DRAFT_68147 [Catenaria anguillulae PL171]
MLTATTKSLLSPIADAVSQLIVITAQAELNGSPIPDLRDVAQLVAQHVYSLAEIGHGLIDPAALAAETRGIVDVTRLLKDMTDACTQRILNTYDDSEIQKSLVVARALVDQSKLITTILGSDLDSPPVIKSLLDNARTFAQQSVFLFHLVHARIPELLSPPIQRALTHHSNALDRAAVGTIAALKYALAGSHQIVPANVDLVKRQLKVHARACEGIAQYIVKDDMPEGALVDEAREQAAGLAAQALSDIGRNEDATELKDKAKNVVEAAKELTTAKASTNPDAAASSEAKLQRLPLERWKLLNRNPSNRPA